MTEYVFRISRRDSAHPLAETVLHEFGTAATSPDAFGIAVAAMGQMIQRLGTPEKVVEFMRKNAVLAAMKQGAKG